MDMYEGRVEQDQKGKMKRRELHHWFSVCCVALFPTITIAADNASIILNTVEGRDGSIFLDVQVRPEKIYALEWAPTPELPSRLWKTVQVRSSGLTDRTWMIDLDPNSGFYRLREYDDMAQFTCVGYLRLISNASNLWAVENQQPPTAPVSVVDISGDGDRFIVPEVNSGLNCPGGGTYAVTDAQTPPTCTMASDGHTL